MPESARRGLPMVIDDPFLKEVQNANPHLGVLLGRIIEGIEGLSNHLQINPKGLSTPPNAHQALNVAAGTDHVHVTITDNSEIRKNAQYFVEWSANDPAFANPHVEHLGASRGRVLALP